MASFFNRFIAKRGSGYLFGPETTSINTRLPANYTDNFVETSIVFACVNRIAQQLGQRERRVVDDDGNMMRKPRWIETPNEYMSGRDMIQAITTQLLLPGTAFLLGLYNRVPVQSYGYREVLGEVHLLNGTRVIADWNEGTTDWRIDGQSLSHLQAEAAKQSMSVRLVPIRMLSLPERLFGVGPAKSIQDYVKISQAGQAYTLAHIERGGAFQWMFMYPRGTDEKLLRRNALKFMARHTGSANAYAPLFLSGEAEVKQMNQTNADAQYLDLSMLSDARIALAFGLEYNEFSPGIPNQSKTYNTEAQRYWRNDQHAYKPVAMAIEEGYTKLLGDGRFDIQQSEALLGGPYDRKDIIRDLSYGMQAQGYQTLTINEQRAILGYPPRDEEWADELQLTRQGEKGIPPDEVIDPVEPNPMQNAFNPDNMEDEDE